MEWHERKMKEQENMKEWKIKNEGNKTKNNNK